jgi:hypothetical protein
MEHHTTNDEALVCRLTGAHSAPPPTSRSEGGCEEERACLQSRENSETVCGSTVSFPLGILKTQRGPSRSHWVAALCPLQDNEQQGKRFEIYLQACFRQGFRVRNADKFLLERSSGCVQFTRQEECLGPRPARGLALWLRGLRGGGGCSVRTTFPTTKITPAACHDPMTP